MIVCPRCARSVDQGNANSGEKVKCPNCDLELVVPNQPPADDGAGQGRGEDDEYALRVETPSPTAEAAREYVPLGNYIAPRMLPEAAAEIEDREQSPWQAVRPAPSRELFFAGTFGFPFRPAAQSQSLLLAGAATLTFLTFKLAIQCADTGAGGFAIGFPILASLLFAGVAVSLLIVWLAAAAIYGICIVRETSYGVESIEDWPHIYSLDAFGELRYVFCALAIGVLPAMVLAPVWDWLGWPKTLMMTISAALLFPLLLMSMLERNSPMIPFSLPVWQSVIGAWRAWGLFFSITLPMAAALCQLTRVATTHAGVWGALMMGILANVAWMIYCRLLGRLAWFCSGQSDAP